MKTNLRPIYSKYEEYKNESSGEIRSISEKLIIDSSSIKKYSESEGASTNKNPIKKSSLKKDSEATLNKPDFEGEIDLAISQVSGKNLIAFIKEMQGYEQVIKLGTNDSSLEAEFDIKKDYELVVEVTYDLSSNLNEKNSAA